MNERMIHSATYIITSNLQQLDVDSNLMGRAPCCEKKMGLKRGPWTAEEDRTLVAHVEQHGHSNWRALPKHAGLLRCGKSCRLRWINYLRPGIKRGNFVGEEEDAIIHLHAMLGNRWSAIAARLPGRTDNEIKNVWHTHLKKRISMAASPEQSLSTSAAADSSSMASSSEKPEEFETDDSFWSDALGMTANSSSTGEPLDADSASPPASSNDELDFWVRLFMQAGDMQNLAQMTED